MESFYEGWVSRQEELLAELQAAPRDHPAALRGLIDRVFAHYHEYFSEKSLVADHDILLLYSPTWLNPHERTFLWITGWHPLMAFSLLRDLREDQRAAVEELKRETAAAGRELQEEMARVQEAMVMPEVLGLVRGGAGGSRDGGPTGGGGGDAGAVEAVISSLRVLAESADALRARAVGKLVDIMDPVQAVDFLTAAAQLQLRIRDWGKRRRAATNA